MITRKPREPAFVTFMLLWLLLALAVDATPPAPAPAPVEETITWDMSFPPFIQQSPTEDNGGSKSKVSMRVIVILGVLLSVLSVFLIIGYAQFIKKLRAKLAENRFNLDAFLENIGWENPIRFTSDQLRVYTNNYSRILGSGGFGKVYFGQLPNGAPCAVKVLQRINTEEQFKAEVITIGRTYHVNLVRLYGFCHDGSYCALVYEFMKNGSLDKYLFMENQTLGFERLYEIAVGTAKGMAYLHEECRQRIIHYDIKPGNILLDDNFSPKIADFGLAKLCNMDQTHVSLTGYRGTPGYSAPEFFLHNFPITFKCDVYSFGMLLFEILGRRKNVKVGDTSSLDWFPIKVWEKFEKGELDEVTGSCGIEEAEGERERERAERLATVALWCVQDSPQERPRMSAVVRMLEGGVEILPPPKPFGFMFSARRTAMNSSSDGHGSTTTEDEDSYWYKDNKSSSNKSECPVEVMDLSKMN